MIKLLLPCAGRAVRIGGVIKELLPLGVQTTRPGSDCLPAPVLAWAFRVGLSAGAESAIVVTSSSKAPVLMDAISLLDLPVPVCYLHQQEPTGLAAAVRSAEPFVSNEDTVLLVMGDTVMWPYDSARSAVKEVRSGTVACATLYRVTTPELFGVAVFDRYNRLERFDDKPKVPHSHWVWTAVAFRRPFFSYLERGMRDSGDSFANALNGAIRDKCLEARFCDKGFYWDVGTYEGYISALSSLAGCSLSEPILTIPSDRHLSPLKRVEKPTGTGS